MTSPLPLAVKLYSSATPPSRLGRVHAATAACSTSSRGSGTGGVETVGVRGGDILAARAALADAGLAVTSTHSWASIDDADAFDRICADAAAIGAPRVIVSGHRSDSRDDVGRFADSLNAGAAIAARHGLRVGIHNHDGEMQDVEGAGPGYASCATRPGPRSTSRSTSSGSSWAAPLQRVIQTSGPRLLPPRQGRTGPPTECQRRPSVRERRRRQWRRGPGAGDRGARRRPNAEWLIVELDHAAGPVIDAVSGPSTTSSGAASPAQDAPEASRD